MLVPKTYCLTWYHARLRSLPLLNPNTRTAAAAAAAFTAAAAPPIAPPPCRAPPPPVPLLRASSRPLLRLCSTSRSMPSPFRLRSGQGASAPSSPRRRRPRLGVTSWSTPRRRRPLRTPQASSRRSCRKRITLPRWRGWRRPHRPRALRRPPWLRSRLLPHRLRCLWLPPWCLHPRQPPRWDRLRRRRFTSVISSPSSSPPTTTSSGVRRFSRSWGVTTC